MYWIMEPHTDTSNPQGAQLTSGLHSASEDLRDLLRAEVATETNPSQSPPEDRSNGPIVAAIVLALVSFATLFAPAMHFRGDEPEAPSVQVIDQVAPRTVAALD